MNNGHYREVRPGQWVRFDHPHVRRESPSQRWILWGVLGVLGLMLLMALAWPVALDIMGDLLPGGHDAKCTVCHRTFRIGGNRNFQDEFNQSVRCPRCGNVDRIFVFKTFFQRGSN